MLETEDHGLQTPVLDNACGLPNIAHIPFLGFTIEAGAQEDQLPFTAGSTQHAVNF
jgi:hypothetical protein